MTGRRGAFQPLPRPSASRRGLPDRVHPVPLGPVPLRPTRPSGPFLAPRPDEKRVQPDPRTEARCSRS